MEAQLSVLRNKVFLLVRFVVVGIPVGRRWASAFVNGLPRQLKLPRRGSECTVRPCLEFLYTKEQKTDEVTAYYKPQRK